MFHAQVPKKTAPIQLLKPKPQTIGITVIQEIKPTQEIKPAKQGFQSICQALWGNSNTVQLTKDGDEIEDENQTLLVEDCLNVVGEYHSQSNKRREQEKRYCRAHTKSLNYWLENEFQDSGGKFGDPIKDRILYGLKWL